jgi:hypothetical protein
LRFCSRDHSRHVHRLIVLAAIGRAGQHVIKGRRVLEIGSPIR